MKHDLAKPTTQQSTTWHDTTDSTTSNRYSTTKYNATRYSTSYRLHNKAVQHDTTYKNKQHRAHNTQERTEPTREHNQLITQHDSTTNNTTQHDRITNITKRHTTGYMHHNLATAQQATPQHAWRQYNQQQLDSTTNTGTWRRHNQ